MRRFKGGPAVISYSIQTDPRWLTKVARVEQVYEGERRSLTVEVKGSRWHVRGKRDPRLDGCLDIDLEASPVTNTLAIRRTALRVGTRAELVAAWVRFPSLEVEPLRQSYERVGEERYVYRSASGFKSEIEVDDLGLVRRYGGYWLALD